MEWNDVIIKNLLREKEEQEKGERQPTALFFSKKNNTFCENKMTMMVATR